MLYDMIDNFVPSCEQEEVDKDLILEFMDTFDDCLTRENKMCHFTSSCFVLNKEHSKVLMIYHNIYNSWAWVGGHADGDSDLLHVCLKEIEEETGLSNVTPLRDGPIAIQVLTVDPHIKRGKYVSSHLHLDCCFVCEASESDLLRVKEDENSGVQWIDIEKVIESSSEEKMKPIYGKIIDKIKKL